MQSRKNCSLAPLIASAVFTAAIIGLAHAKAPPPKHLTWALRLVNTVEPGANLYGDPAQITWKTENGLDHSTNRTKCASLVTQLLLTAYGEPFAGWLGCASPIAATYHDAIEVEHGFMLVESIHAITVGDVIAIRYLDAGCTNLTCGGFKNCTSSGHVALVAAPPQLRAPTSPIIPGTQQFAVDIIDSTSDIHGVSDTRYQADPGHVDDQGVGRGTMRLYVDSVDPDHPIVGYTWSTWAGSVFHGPKTRDLVIGRIRPRARTITAPSSSGCWPATTPATTAAPPRASR